MSGENEEAVIKALDFWGYKLNQDYVRQHPIANRFVLDFAFIKEQVCIEVDGEKHRTKKSRRADNARDNYLYLWNWVVIRIPERLFFKKASTFYKHLIKEVVEERRNQWEVGRLYPIDIPDYKDEQYE